MLRKALVLLMVFFVMHPFQARAQDSFFQIGAGGIKGIYFPLAKRLCHLVNDIVRVHGYRCGIATSGGSLENLAGLREGRYDFALVQSNSLLEEANLHNSSPFKTVAALYAEPIHVVVRDHSNIDDIADLASATVNMGDLASGTTRLAEALLEASGIALNDIQTQRFGPEQQARRLCQGDVAALIFVAGIRNTSMTEVHRRCKVRMISIPPEIVERLGARIPGLVPVTIPANTYPQQTAPVQSVGPIARLVAATQTSDELVAIVARALNGEFGSFTDVHPVLQEFIPNRLRPLFAGEYYHSGVLTRPRQRPVTR